MGTSAERERDELRVRVIDLEETVRRLGQVRELDGQVATLRAEEVRHLLDAIRAGTRIEALQREMVAALDEALAGFTRPGHLGQLERTEGRRP
jgi:hypothetical protein